MLWVILGFAILVGGAVMYLGWKLIRDLD